MKKAQKGFSLFEVLISMLIASVGILGAVGVLLIGGKSGTSSYLQQTSGQLALEIVDRMRTNPTEVSQGKYDVAMGAAPSSSQNCVTSSCSLDGLASYDTAQWVNSLQSRLPQGQGSVTTQTTGNTTVITVVVQWSDSPAKRAFKESDAEAPARYTLQTVL